MAAERKKELFVEATRLIKAGKYGQASKVLKELMVLEPANVEYRRLSASLNLKLGNLISAKAVYESLAQEALQMRDRRLAESLLREYLAAAPRYVPFLELLGRVCEENDNGIVAANEYAKALQILLDDADPGEAGHAADLQAKIRNLSPNNPVLAQYDAAKFGRAPQPAAPSPIETNLKAKPAAPPVPPPAPAAPPPTASVAPPSAPVAPVSKKPARPPATPPPMVDDDLTDLLSKPIPKVTQIPKRQAPRAAPPPPMVDDDLTDLLSKPIPKVTQIPKREAPPPPPPSAEKPSLTKALFGFLQSSPAPEPAPPAAAEPSAEPPAAAGPGAAGPGEAVSAAPPQWKPWQPEPAEAAAPAAGPAETAPAAPPQETAWKPWQPPEGEPTKPAEVEAAPEPALAAGRHPASPAGGRSDQAMPSLPGSGVASAVVRERRAASAPLPRRAATGRRSGGLGKTVRTLATLVVVVAVAAGVLFGALAVGLFMFEKGPTDVFRNFTGSPPPSAQDPRKSAYSLLLGFDADAGRDPMAEGYQRLQQSVSTQPIQCAWEGAPPSAMRFPADTVVVEKWWQGLDPAGQFQKEAGRIRGWTAGSPVVLARYRQWMGMPFEDGGYGKFAVPNCALIVAAHRLHVAEGFGEGLAKGIEVLEKDLTTWRTTLAQARTLPVKQLALAIVNDDLTLLAGVFGRPELTPDTVSRLAQLTKPLDQVERSLRWPMQNALAVDTKLFATNALFDAVREPSPLVRVLMWLPLPRQRGLNAYAEHYEALLRAVDQPLTQPPSSYGFARTPPTSVMDYLVNPIDNLVPSRTVIAWDQQAGSIIETDARLRLVGLSALLRGVSRKAIAGRIAEAGSKYTDPFTELPMLLNTSRGYIYSVGKNHRDDDGDPKLDVSIAWLFTEPPKEAPKGRGR